MQEHQVFWRGFKGLTTRRWAAAHMGSLSENQTVLLSTVDIMHQEYMNYNMAPWWLLLGISRLGSFHLQLAVVADCPGQRHQPRPESFSGFKTPIPTVVATMLLPLLVCPEKAKLLL